MKTLNVLREKFHPPLLTFFARYVATDSLPTQKTAVNSRESGSQKFCPLSLVGEGHFKVCFVDRSLYPTVDFLYDAYYKKLVNPNYNFYIEDVFIELSKKETRVRLVGIRSSMFL